MDGNILEYGIGGLLAITILKTVLPYVRPAKNGQDTLSKEMKPLHERQIVLLEKMNERDIETNSKVKSNHDSLKTINLDVHDHGITLDAIHRRLDGIKGTNR